MRNIPFRLSVLWCLLVLLSSPVAHAWNNFGHMLVARIAWENMTPEQRTQASEVLRGLGADYDMLTKGKPANVDEGTLRHSAALEHMIHLAAESC